MNPHREDMPAGAGFTRSDYHLPGGLTSRVALSALLGRRRDMLADATALLAPPCPPPRMAGEENIPPTGPFLLVMNHYARPGLDAWWAAVLATWAVGQVRPSSPPRWLMVSEWAWPSWQYRLIITPVTRLAFAGFAGVYGMILTPPVLNPAYSPQEGARAVRRFLRAAGDAVAQGQALAIAPEGREGHLGALTTLPPGTGRFLILLSVAGLPILPVGVSEDPPGELIARFGPASALTPPAGLRRLDADGWAAAEVMGRVAALLPPDLRGPYAASGAEGRPA